MQDRYFGDVGDFGKYGILRVLTGRVGGVGSPLLSLGVVWYLFPDEIHNADGKHVGYLADRRDSFELCDPQLFAGLKRRISAGERSVAHAADESVLGSNTTYFSDRLVLAGTREERVQQRRRWFGDALTAMAGSEVVFLDPDNGLPPSDAHALKPIGGKFVGEDELTNFAAHSRTVVLYQHANRSGSVADQAKRWGMRIQQLVPTHEIHCLAYRRGTVRFFFVLASPQHGPLIRERVQILLEGDWRHHLQLLDVGSIDHIAASTL